MIRSARVLLYVGVIVVVAGTAKLHAVVYQYDLTGSARFAWVIFYAVLLAITAYAAGLPEVPKTSREIVATALAAATMSALGISLLQLVLGDALLPRVVVFGSALVLGPWYMVCAALAVGARARAEDMDRVVMVSDSTDVVALRADLAAAPERPATIVGVLSIDAVAGNEGPGVLVEEVESTGATVVVIDREAQSLPSIIDQAAILHSRGVRIRTLSLFFEQWLGKLPMTELEQISLMFDIGEVHRDRYARLKRVLDTGVALGGLVVLVVLVPLVFLVNVLFNRGPVFYRQDRVGKAGEVFEMLKLRTMVERADDGDTRWTEEEDDRVTPFGRVLRTSHLDELPQVLNILRGDLSVVGPRPEQPHYVAQLAEQLPYYDLRHLVRPGLTGWAQVKFRYGANAAEAFEKLQFEFYYLRHQSLMLDLRIVGRTTRSVLMRAGR